MNGDSNNGEKKIEFLKEVYTEIHEQQKFAEEKNGALIGGIAVFLGFLFGNETFLTTSPDSTSIPCGLKAGFVAGIVLLSLAMAISAFSFFPNLNEFKKEKNSRVNKIIKTKDFINKCKDKYRQCGISIMYNNQDNVKYAIKIYRNSLINYINKEEMENNRELNENEIIEKGVEFIVEKGKNKNLLYFGSIARMGEGEYLSKVKEIIGDDEEISKLLSKQIVINSEIANKKYRIFRIAAVLTAPGVASIMISCVCKLLFV